MGELLSEKVNAAMEKDSSLTITKLAERMGLSRKTFYNWIAKDTLPFHVLREFGRVIKYDFSQDIPEMKRGDNMNFREELSGIVNPDEKLEAALIELDAWKEKYINLQKELNACKDQLITVLTGAKN